jgi:hypothetical protein
LVQPSAAGHPRAPPPRAASPRGGAGPGRSDFYEASWGLWLSPPAQGAWGATLEPLPHGAAAHRSEMAPTPRRSPLRPLVASARGQRGDSEARTPVLTGRAASLPPVLTGRAASPPPVLTGCAAFPADAGRRAGCGGAAAGDPRELRLSARGGRCVTRRERRLGVGRDWTWFDQQFDQFERNANGASSVFAQSRNTRCRRDQTTAARAAGVRRSA